MSNFDNTVKKWSIDFNITRWWTRLKSFSSQVWIKKSGLRLKSDQECYRMLRKIKGYSFMNCCYSKWCVRFTKAPFALCQHLAAHYPLQNWPLVNPPLEFEDVTGLFLYHQNCPIWVCLVISWLRQQLFLAVLIHSWWENLGWSLLFEWALSCSVRPP